MVKYQVKPEMKEDKSFCWSVFEVATEQVVARESFEDDARRFSRSLSARKVAFDGWTPRFFLKPTLLNQIKIS